MKKHHSTEAKFILYGRIAYAAERGGITLNESRNLEELLGGEEKSASAFAEPEEYNPR